MHPMLYKVGIRSLSNENIPYSHFYSTRVQNEILRYKF